MGFGIDVGAIGLVSIVSILVYLAVIYAIVFWIVLPAISIVAKMFGFPGMV
jgi:uncharacterized membrane protein